MGEPFIAAQHILVVVILKLYGAIVYRYAHLLCDALQGCGDGRGRSAVATQHDGVA